MRIRVDDEGEVLARSNHVFEGYGNQPDDTAKAIVEGWFHTGVGGVREGAYLSITDRKKDVVITGGENVASIEVEDCLFQHPAVAEAAVIGVPDEKWGETIMLAVVQETARDRSLPEDFPARAACPGRRPSPDARPAFDTGTCGAYCSRTGRRVWLDRGSR